MSREERPTATRALIIEDDPQVARAIARRFIREGFEVTVASSLAAARQAGGGFGIAVFDLDLPDGTGPSLADELLSLGAVEQAVFYTSSTDEALLRRARSLGNVVEKARGVEALLVVAHPLTIPPESHTTESHAVKHSEMKLKVAPEAARPRAKASRH